MIYLFNTIPRRIKLFWDFNTTDWDLKGYYITIKKGTGIIAISNMKNVFLLKDKNEYIINNFDWNTLYEIKNLFTKQYGSFESSFYITIYE